MIVIAARPSMGKSAFCLQIMTNMAKAGKKIILFSLEMSSELCGKRILFTEAELNLDEALRGIFSKEKYNILGDKVNNIYDAKITIDETPGLQIWQLISKAKMIKESLGGLDAIFLDYLQLVKSPEHDKQGLNAKMTVVSNEVKNLARKMRVPLYAVSQMSRDIEKRKDQCPILSDLRDSGTIEQDADKIIFLHRQEIYGTTEENRGICKVVIAKNKNGKIKQFNLRFEKEIMKFFSIEANREEQWQDKI
jgi:replicative DNA helicase